MGAKIAGVGSAGWLADDLGWDYPKIAQGVVLGGVLEGMELTAVSCGFFCSEN